MARPTALPQLVLRRLLLLLLLSPACLLLDAADLHAADAAKRPPNIVYILADDLGYGDLGCYGQEKIRTPRIDAMAGAGMRFTSHYAGAPLCAPSRCTLMTGLHTGHARIRENSKLPLAPEDTTLAQVLQQAGYATGAFGKWGLGLDDTTGAPAKKGFDHFLGYTNQSLAHFYYPESIIRDGQPLELPGNRNGKRETYSHDLLTAGALEFIRENQQRPFFLYVPYTIPHAEVLVPEDSLAEYRGKWPETPYPGGHYAAQPEPRAARAGMITRMDRDVGQILDLLDKLHLSENTLVIFTSDNGPVTAGGQDIKFFNSAGPLRGTKFTLWDGGIRVPMIARWLGKIEKGTTSDFPSAFWDMFPTFCEVAALPAPQGLDGVSMLPVLQGKSTPEKRPPLYFEYHGSQAVRDGDWKALRLSQKAPLQLFNLTKDIGETTDLAAAHPDVLARLESLIKSEHVDSPDFPLTPAPKKNNKQKNNKQKQ